MNINIRFMDQIRHNFKEILICPPITNSRVELSPVSFCILSIGRVYEC